MECLRRAMIEGQPPANRDANLKHATKLMSLYKQATRRARQAPRQGPAKDHGRTCDGRSWWPGDRRRCQSRCQTEGAGGSRRRHGTRECCRSPETRRPARLGGGRRADDRDGHCLLCGESTPTRRSPSPMLSASAMTCCMCMSGWPCSCLRPWSPGAACDRGGRWDRRGVYARERGDRPFGPRRRRVLGTRHGQYPGLAKVLFLLARRGKSVRCGCDGRGGGDIRGPRADVGQAALRRKDEKRSAMPRACGRRKAALPDARRRGWLGARRATRTP